MNEYYPSRPNAAFSDPDRAPGPLGPSEAAGLLAAAGDLALVLDPAGVVLDAVVPHPDLAERGLGDWVGRPWIDVVTPEGRPKVADMLAGLADGRPARWRQVNHPSRDGDIPVRYLVVALGGGRAAAIGREMREAAAVQQRLLQTQQSLERDYLQLRQAETRFRLLFDLSAEPVLVVEAATRRIRDANAAAYRLLGWGEGALPGRSVSAIVDEAQRDALVAHLGAAEASDAVPPLPVDLAGARGRAAVTARLFRQGRTALLLLRILPAEPGRAAPDAPALPEIVERMPDAFVVTDADFTLLAANAAFAELAGRPSPDRVLGERLDAWLGRPGVDLDLIAAQLREHGAARNVATVVQGAGLRPEEVELSAVRAPGEDGADRYGFVIRGVGRRARGRPAVERELPRSVEQLTELVGRMSLKEIVRESTDLIERLCIEAALAYTEDNRASAAELLGLSRQSLYSKLHRHGLGNLSAEEESVN